ncbi:MAG TPA: tRNA (guanosine(37)-N1)-methyltransferase TrmD [Nitrospirae bacterium]|nr:tRNA (guanosine(37)-N1)-methyltransferase TrmD [Nitrospirota bacterium]
MVFEVLTIFPAIIEAYLSESIMRRAVERGALRVDVYNIRDFTTDRHRQVDDYPYGGGAGMVLKPEPVFNAIEHIERDGLERRRVLLTPGGRVFSQSIAEEYARQERRILLIAGRYEGIDERIRTVTDEELSIGDYVLTGGELPALVIIDAVTRLLPGVLGDSRSAEEESFTTGLLDHPHYTRPVEFRGMRVPEVLLGGNHRLIRRWRRREALRRTLRQRPDLLDKADLSEEDQELLEEIKEEEE